MEREKYSGEERTIKFLQDNLATLRKISGWTMQELGDKIGVTKQTISNLEKHKNKMSKLQAIGLAHVFLNEYDFDQFCPKSYVDGWARETFLEMVIEKLYHEDLPEEEAKKYQEKYGFAATLIENGDTLEKVAEALGLPVERLLRVGTQPRPGESEEVRDLRVGLRKSQAGLPSEKLSSLDKNTV